MKQDNDTSSEWATFEWLNLQYHTNGLSTYQIGQLVGRSDVTIGNWLRKYGIKRRSISEDRLRHHNVDCEKLISLYESGLTVAEAASQLGITYTKAQARLSRLGYKCRSREKSRELGITRRDGRLPRSEWGTKEWLTDRYVIQKMSARSIAKQIGWSTNAVVNQLKSLDIKIRDAAERAGIALSKSPRISGIQRKLYEYLNDLGIEYYTEGPKTRCGRYVFDCLIPSSKLFIECQGDYYHTRSKALANDRKKYLYTSERMPGYEIIYVWEHEFSMVGRVIDRLALKVKAKIPTIDFDFNDLVMYEVSTADSKEFYDLYHYLGAHLRGGITFAVSIKDKCIAHITFGSPVRQNMGKQYGLCTSEMLEITRLCIHPSYHKKNFGSWIVSHALNRIDKRYKLVFAFADTTFGHVGTVYKASNFRLHHESTSDYWYTDGQDHYLHKKTLYNRAKVAGLTEAEFAESRGFSKVYGGPKKCYVRWL